MEFQGIIISGLAIIAAATTLITQAIKVMLGNRDYNSNLIAAVVSVIVSLFMSIGYVIFNEVSVDAKFIFTCICMCVLSWLCSMLGYDKVVQMLFNKES